MQVKEIWSVARPAEPIATFYRLWQLNLNDVRSPVRELSHACGPGTDPCEVKNGETFQGFRGNHFGFPFPTLLSLLLVILKRILCNNLIVFRMRRICPRRLLSAAEDRLPQIHHYPLKMPPN